MAQAYDAIIATITVASDASQVVKTMVKSTQWRAGTSGTWLSTDCTLTAGNTFQFRTPNSGMTSSSVTILPNIKAGVTVDWDTSGSTISTGGNYFMYAYAQGCNKLTSLSVPDTSNLTYAGNYFMHYYAAGCSSLTSLSVPDTSSLTIVGSYFTNRYAQYCTSLTSLILPESTGWFSGHNIDWGVHSGRLGYLYGYAPNSTSQSNWQSLTVSGKTLYTNYIQGSSYILAPDPDPEPEPDPTPTVGNKYPLPPFRRA